MKTVEIQVNAARDGEKVGGTVKLERKQLDGTWKAEREWKVESAEPSAYRKLFVEDDQRVVIEGKSNTRLEYDPVQAVVREVPFESSGETEEKSNEDRESDNGDGDAKVLKDESSKPFRGPTSPAGSQAKPAANLAGQTYGRPVEKEKK